MSRYREIVAERIGRPLTSEEVVHHINGNHRDDRPANLQLLPNHRMHKKVHHAMHVMRRAWGAPTPREQRDALFSCPREKRLVSPKMVSELLEIPSARVASFAAAHGWQVVIFPTRTRRYWLRDVDQVLEARTLDEVAS